MEDSIIQEAFRQLGTIAQSVSQLNHDYTQLAAEHAKQSVNVEWLMRFFWIIATASVGSFIATLWQIITRRNKKE